MQNICVSQCHLSWIHIPSIPKIVHTPLVFLDFPQFFDSLPSKSSQPPPSLSISPPILPLQPPVPTNSTLISNDISHLRRSARTTQPPHYLEQYYYGTMAQIPSADPISISGKPHSLFSFLSTSQLSSPHRAFTSSVSLVFEPKTYKQASTIPHW